MIKNKKVLYAVFVMIAIIILFGVFLIIRSLNQNKKIKQEEYSFNRKKECVSYINDIENKIMKEWNSGSISVSSSLDEIWYSSKLNSCLYSVNGFYSYGNKIKTSSYFIYDYLSNKLVGSYDTKEKFESIKQDLR